MKKSLIQFCKDLYPVYRSLTGKGVRQTLEYISNIVPFEIKTVKSGTRCFDWIVPPEWNIEEAYIVDLSTNEKIVDFRDHNLHIVGYSVPVDIVLTFEELDKHLFHLENLPDAIPYITSYYSKFWGFCLTYNNYKRLDREGKYHVVIKSAFKENGELTYGELFIPGKSDKEIFISSYICHPQMVNNELSGPAVLTALADYVYNLKNRNLSYRFVLIPETIGSIAYLSLNHTRLKSAVAGGFNITCVGDERAWGHIPSRFGNNISDKIAKHVLHHTAGHFEQFSWLDRGSDERQYCAPGIDLPISSITRSKYGTYAEYHTSLDDFNLVTQKGLEESLDVHKKCLFVFENNFKPKLKVLCEPQLGKRGLYPNISTKSSGKIVRNMMNFLSYCDGETSILEIAELCNLSFFEAYEIYEKISQTDLF